jgi:hypothetical protein
MKTFGLSMTFFFFSSLCSMLPPAITDVERENALEYTKKLNAYDKQILQQSSHVKFLRNCFPLEIPNELISDIYLKAENIFYLKDNYDSVSTLQQKKDNYSLASADLKAIVLRDKIVFYNDHPKIPQIKMVLNSHTLQEIAVRKIPKKECSLMLDILSYKRDLNNGSILVSDNTMVTEYQSTLDQNRSVSYWTKVVDTESSVTPCLIVRDINSSEHALFKNMYVASKDERIIFVNPYADTKSKELWWSHCQLLAFGYGSLILYHNDQDKHVEICQTEARGPIRMPTVQPFLFPCMSFRSAVGVGSAVAVLTSALIANFLGLID